MSLKIKFKALLLGTKLELKSMLKNMRKNALPYLMISPVVIIVLIEVIFPLLITADTSLRHYTASAESYNPYTYEYPYFIGFDNYIAAISMPSFWRVLFNTFAWTFICVGLHTLFGILFALLLNKDFYGKTFFRTMVIIPWAVPSYVTTYIWRVFILQDSSLGNPGLISMILTSLGLPEIRWLSSDVVLGLPMIMWSAIIVNTWLGIPFMAITILAGLQSIPQDLYEAADIEGANRWQKFRHITLPLVWPSMIVAVLLGIIWTFNMFNVIYIMALNTEIPVEQYSILAVWVYNLAFYQQDKGMAAAVAWIIFLILLFMSFIYKKIATRYGGLK
ncbi:MAG: sugar ABC transporter permease [Candidatus Korarchaeota archaeon]